MNQKRCFKCMETKGISDFYTHPRMADGHLGKCKACAKLDTAARVEILSRDPFFAVAERARHRLKSRVYRAAGRVSDEALDSMRFAKLKYIDRNPAKRAAHSAVSNALRAGLLTCLTCEQCGNPKAQAHHDDYARPLDVRWLCTTHHAEHHVAERERLLFSK